MKKYILVLSVISSLAVVMMHANGTFWIFSYEPYWVIANLIECLCYFAVPVFFMISGANLIEYRKKYDTKIYFKKRVIKTGLPYLIWSGIGCAYQVYLGNLTRESFSIRSVINALLNSDFVSVYWFFMPLFGAYLCIPALAMIPENARKNIFKYLIISSFLFNILFPFVCGLIGISYNWNATVASMGGYLFFILAGYYIDHYSIERKVRILIYLSGFVGLLMHFLGTWYLSVQDGTINQTYKGYLTLPCVLYSTAIFLLFKNMNTGKAVDFLYRKLSYIASTTFGVYLLHWFILDIEQRHIVLDRTLWYCRVGEGIVIFIVAVLIIKVLQKIPIVRKIVP